MRRRRVERTRIIIIGFLTILTGMVWVGAEVYHRLTTDRISPQVETEITPLNPSLDLQVLDQIESKRSLPIDYNLPLEQQARQIPRPSQQEITFTQVPETNPETSSSSSQPIGPTEK